MLATNVVNKFRLYLVLKVYADLYGVNFVVVCTISVLIIVQCDKCAIIQGYCLIWQLSLLFTQTVSRDGRQCIACHCFNLPWVGVHAFWSNVLQVILGSYPPHLRSCWKYFPSARTHASHLTNTLVIARPSAIG